MDSRSGTTWSMTERWENAMSEEYTPSMKQLRTFWETHGTHVPAASAYLRMDRKAEFDRAIAARDAELREQIAQEIEEADCHETCGSLYRKGIERAAEIARGKAS